MASDFIDTVCQTIYPGDCDVMGHLNTRHYTALFDHAKWQLLRHLRVGDAVGAGARVGWADVESVVTYRREVSAGAAVRVRSRLMRVGNKSIVTEHVLLLDSSEDECAVCRTTSARLDLVARRSVEVPEVLRAYRVPQDAQRHT
jgi:acyl-CoA thioester hydrolase